MGHPDELVVCMRGAGWGNRDGMAGRGTVWSKLKQRWRGQRVTT